MAWDRAGRPPAGFTLLEVMVSVLLVGLTAPAVVAALLACSNVLNAAQHRQNKTVLVDARTQRLLLSNKAALASGPPAPQPLPASNPANLPVGTAPWTVDPLPPATDNLGVPDLSTGAYFTETASGKLVPATGIAAGTPCSQVPMAVYCREVFVTNSLPATPGSIAVGGTSLGSNAAILPAGNTPYTVWVRVTRGGELLINAVVDREVILQ